MTAAAAAPSNSTEDCEAERLAIVAGLFVIRREDRRQDAQAAAGVIGRRPEMRAAGEGALGTPKEAWRGCDDLGDLGWAFAETRARASAKGGPPGATELPVEDVPQPRRWPGSGPSVTPCWPSPDGRGAEPPSGPAP